MYASARLCVRDRRTVLIHDDKRKREYRDAKRIRFHIFSIKENNGKHILTTNYADSHKRWRNSVECRTNKSDSDARGQPLVRPIFYGNFSIGNRVREN